ncbi:MAG: TlpA family protein disulfide reductase [Opitutaceae bacterium]|nr:TlpA family protein disulfide reductase [Opitutaceae bacterium]
MHSFPVSLLAAVIIAVASVRGAGDPAFTQLKTPLEPTPEMLAVADADAAFKAVSSLSSMEALMAAAAGKKTQEERMAAMRQLVVKVVRTGSAFLQMYPDDPRRWRVVQMLESASKELATDDGAPKAALEGVTWDPATFAAWRKQIVVLSAAAEHAPDAPPEVKWRSESGQPGGLRSMNSAVQKAVAAKESVDFGPLKAEILRLASKYPTVEGMGAQTGVYFTLRTRSGAAKPDLIADAELFAASPNAAVKKAAQAELDKLTAFDKPFELVFTAVDGRKVDIKDYRGKVVLVDFWATWCGPCKAEIPNIKKVYAEYQAKGFEIIGISLENAAIKPDDTAEQIAAKHEKARNVLADFTSKTEMPWPQYYDGKHWKNDVSTRFGIASIPAMFLIDPEGRIASTEARGPKLEAEIKRLLKL